MGLSDSLKTVIVSTGSFALDLPGDSGLFERSMRARITDLVAVIIGALVRFSAWLPASAADRTSFRLEEGWTITRTERTPTTSAMRPAGAGNPTFHDRIHRPESPGQ